MTISAADANWQTYLYGTGAPPLAVFGRAQVHQALLPALNAMAAAAAKDGFELLVASGYRDFSRQLSIFNRKASGQLPLLDSQSQRLDPSQLSEQQLLHAILRWSALPGGSRHHWGCEIDVYDGRPCAQGYQLQLTAEETCGDQPMAAFHRWLSQYLAGQDDFYRPYQEDQGGVAPEPWHLSYAPLARRCEASFELSALRELIAASELALKPLVLAQLDELFLRYIKVW